MKKLIHRSLLLLAVTNSIGINACEVSSDLEEANGYFRYELSDSSLSVIDLGTGLMWQRCSVGQTYNSETGSCDGSGTTYSDWYSALQAVSPINISTFDGYGDWRIPNTKELWSLVETGCTSPSINAIRFPDSPSGYSYSSTPTRSTDIDGNATIAGQGLKVPFAFGTSLNLTYLRLVRNYN